MEKYLEKIIEQIEILNIQKPEFDKIDKKYKNVDKRLKCLEANIIKIIKSLEILIEYQKKSYLKEIIQFTKFYSKKIILLTALLTFYVHIFPELIILIIILSYFL